VPRSIKGRVDEQGETDMSDTNAAPPPRQTDRWLEPGPSNMMAVYILYLAGFVIGITPLIGVVMAYINRGKSEPWVETHYTWAIRTFWIGLLYSLIAVVLTILLIGFILFIAVAVWFIVRIVLGMQALNRNEPVRKPESWII
jgi:uncharacterized membrane protein